MRVVLLCLSLTLSATPSWSQEALGLVAPAEVSDSGLLQHILPRFSLKTGIRVIADDGGVLVLETAPPGDPVFARDFNDVDFCLRVKEMGWRTAWTPYARFVHYEGTSLVRKAPDGAEWDEFRSRHEAILKCDPFYSPALGQTIERLYDIR